MHTTEHCLKEELYELIQSNRDILEFIQESSIDGLWYWDLQEPKNEWTDLKFWATLGYEPTNMPHQANAWKEAIFPEDLRVVEENVARHVADPSFPYDQIVRHLHKNGSTVWTRCRGLAIRNTEGKPIRMLSAHMDVTKLKQREEELIRKNNELRASEQELQSFLDNASDLIQSVDSQGKLIYVNPAWCQTLGYTAEQASTLTIYDIIEPDYHQYCQNKLEQLTKTQKPIKVNLLFRGESGNTVQIEGNISIHPKPDGQFVTRGIFQDVTLRKQAEGELQRMSEMLEQTNAVARVGGWEVDLVRNTVYWTQMTHEIHEVDVSFVPELATGINFYKEGYSRETIQQVINRTIQTGEPWDVELQIITAKGKEVWVRAIGRAEFKENTCIRLYGTFQDIDEQKKKETHLKLLESVITHAKDAVMITGVDTSNSQELKIVYVNEAFCDMSGYCREEIIGKTPWMFQGSQTDKHELARIRQAIEDRQPVEATLVNYKKGDQPYWANLSIVPVVDQNGDCTHFVTIERDVTEQKLNEESLQNAIRQAESASMAKSEFLANMSHEIRTPLNGVIGFTDLLMKTHLNENQRQYMQAVHQSGTALLDLINDILDFSKIEAGKLELSEEKCDLLDLMEQVSNVIKPKLNDHSLELLLNIAPEVPQYAWIDPVRIRQVLVNLLGNAIKFTKTGEIEISVQPVPEASNGSQASLEFSIRDTGIGIDPDRQKNIFKAFSQEDASITRKYGGTGLGLTISNQLLKLMGSKMELESTPGVGSRFFFQLQLETELGNAPLPTSGENMRHVLVVDDHPKNLLIIQNMLSLIHITSDTAKNGLEALEKLKENAYDGLIIDYQMPYLNGIQTIEQVRETLNLSREDLPIFLLHSTANDKEINAAKQAFGIQKILSKPLTIRQLTQTLQASTNKYHTTQSAPQATLILDRHIDILLVDDNSMNRRLAKTMIHKILPGAIVREANDGKEAVQKFQQEGADIILMDIQMPYLSGYQASQQIRELDQGKKVTIIALTAGTVKGERERCLEAGMDDYLSKPFSMETFRATLHPWIHTKNSIETSTTQQKAETRNSELRHIHIERCKNALSIDDEAILEELIDEFFQQLHDDIPYLYQAFREKDLERLKKIGHKHKSSAQMVCMDVLATLLTSLEKQNTYHEDVMKGIIQQIEQELYQAHLLFRTSHEETDTALQRNTLPG